MARARTFRCTGCGTKIPLTPKDYDDLLDRLRRGYVVYCESCRHDPMRLPPWDAVADEQGYVWWPGAAEQLVRQRSSIWERIAVRLLAALLGLGYGLVYPFWWLMTIPLRAYDDVKAMRTPDDPMRGRPSLFTCAVFFLLGIVGRTVFWPIPAVLTWITLPFKLILVLAGGAEPATAGAWYARRRRLR